MGGARLGAWTVAARRAQAGGARGRARVMGVDETAVRVNGETVGGVVTDFETGQVPGLEVLVERDLDGFMEWLGDFARDYGVEAMVADDLSRVQAGGRASGNQASDLHSPREESGEEPARQYKRLGLGQGEDMAAADGSAIRRRLGASSSGARGSGRRRDSPPPLRGSGREVAGAVTPPAGGVVYHCSAPPDPSAVTPPAAGRPMYEQRDGARDMRNQDDAEWVWA